MAEDSQFARLIRLAVAVQGGVAAIYVPLVRLHDYLTGHAYLRDQATHNSFTVIIGTLTFVGFLTLVSVFISFVFVAMPFFDDGGRLGQRVLYSAISLCYSFISFMFFRDAKSDPWTQSLGIPANFYLAVCIFFLFGVVQRWLRPLRAAINKHFITLITTVAILTIPLSAWLLHLSGPFQFVGVDRYDFELWLFTFIGAGIYAFVIIYWYWKVMKKSPFS